MHRWTHRVAVRYCHQLQRFKVHQKMNMSSNNKRIAKNTLLLYVRMILIMGISLYTSRVILRVLGVIDFGIYNVVGGVVTMFSFLNSALGSSTQRYITFALGKNNRDELKNIFTSSIIIHGAIALLILLLAESIGLWFLYNKLVIPEERMQAAFWTFQASVCACMINVLSVPYNSLIIAHERVGAFAYISILEVTLKLLLVFGISIIEFDKLILYSLFILLTNISIRLIYQLYCKKHFIEARLVKLRDRKQFKGMLSFSGWTLIGMLAWTCQTQGLNILLNMFFGPVVNAARALADQVNNAIMQVVNNFQLAAKPQIIKLFAGDEIEHMNSLVMTVSAFSAYLLIIIFIPISVNVECILDIWLEDYPELTATFINIILIQSLSQVLVAPVIIISHAVGKMKMPNIFGGLTYLLTLPTCYIVLKLGGGAVLTIFFSLIPIMIKGFWDVYFSWKYTGFNLSRFYIQVYFKIFAITVLIYVALLAIKDALCLDCLTELVIVSSISIVLTLLVVYLLGLTHNQRQMVNNYIQKRIFRR